MSRAVSLLVLSALASGCGFVPRHQYSACETQARMLDEQSKAQLAEIANLKAHNHKLEDQLLEADKALAGFEKRADADQKRITNFQVERDRVQEQVTDLVRGAKISGIVPVRDNDVEQLSKRFPLLRFEPSSGAYKLEVAVLFDKDGTRIAPESEKMLTEFAAMFAEPEARDLRVMVVGKTSASATMKNVSASSAAEIRQGTDRAITVAQFLRKVGLAGERIGVSGVTADAAAAKGSAGKGPGSQRVEIFVMGKRTPIVGWEDAAGGRF
jgi:outer membrane protein OmpA-like peptidoglycan-associated protein